MWSALTLPQILQRIIAALLIVGLHGLAVAALALWLGDRGPKHEGRVTLNPIAHLDLIGAVGIVFFGMGWAKPVAIDPNALKTGRLGIVLVVGGAFLVTLAGAVVFLLLRLPVATMLSGSLALWLAAILSTAAQLSLWTALLNLVPIPPLTGGHLLGAAFPEQRDRIAKAALYTTILIAAAVVSGLARWLLDPAYRALAELIGAS